MIPTLLPILTALLFTIPLSSQADTKPISNITVIGAVFCDACSINRFSNHSYFLQGARVHVECKFRANSTSTEDITISAERTTDGRGIYTVDVPPVDGFDCREGREIESFCRAALIGSPPTQCNVPGLSSSTEHVAVKCGPGSNVCAFILNALNYRPPKRDDAMCGGITQNKVEVEVQQLSRTPSSNMNSSLFFWPPFGFPHWQFPFPFPNPPSLPFPFPPIPFFTPPAFQLPPLPFFTPPPAFQFPPIPFFTPSPPPPAFSLPLPPLPPLPQFPPIPPIGTLPPMFVPSPPPPSPPPPSPPPPAFLFPFPPFPPLFPAPRQPSPPGPPPPAFSLRDPRTWFPFYPPSEELKDQKP